MVSPRLAVDIGKLRLKNPVMVASGTFGYGEEFKELMDVRRLGAIVTKTITMQPRGGNPPPRIIETSSGMLNSVGLQNEGVAYFIKEKLPFLRSLDTPIIVSIAGEKPNDYSELAKRLDGVEGVAGLELNISCPNIQTSHKSYPNGHRQVTSHKLIAQDAKATYKVVKAARKATRFTLITKLSPLVTDIVSIAEAACDAGTDGVSLVNTFLGMAVDVLQRKSKLGTITGGLSGPAIKPLALRMVWEVAQNVEVPVVGMGGIINIEDVIEFILCGATAVAVGTANFVNPQATTDIIEGVERYMREKEIKGIEELRRSLIYPKSSE